MEFELFVQIKACNYELVEGPTVLKLYLSIPDIRVLSSIRLKKKNNKSFKLTCNIKHQNHMHILPGFV